MLAMEPVTGLEPITPDYKSGALPITLMPALVGGQVLRGNCRDSNGVRPILILGDTGIAEPVVIVEVDMRDGTVLGDSHLNVWLLGKLDFNATTRQAEKHSSSEETH